MVVEGIWETLSMTINLTEKLKVYSSFQDIEKVELYVDVQDISNKDEYDILIKFLEKLSSFLGKQINIFSEYDPNNALLVIGKT